MALIGKIRKQSGLLLIVIGLAMVLFVVGDMFRPGSNFFGGADDTVAELNGEEISYREYEGRVETEVAILSQGNPVNDQQRQSIRDQLWETMIEEKVYSPIYEDLGIHVTTDELYNEIKKGNPILQQYFTNPQTGKVYDELQNPATGALDPNKVILYLKQSFESQQDSRWIPVERAIKFDRHRSKYLSLIKKGIYVTGNEAKHDYMAKNRQFNINYVMAGYTSIGDSAITVTDAELKSYFEKHKTEKEYQQKETTRSIEYVAFDALPSDEDVTTVEKEITAIKEEFKTAENDTLFVVREGDNPDIAWKAPGSYNPDIDSLIFNLDSGDVYGPYRDGDAYKLVKVVKYKFASDSVKARHILLKLENGRDSTSALAMADSLKKVIKSKNNFAEMALEFSGDFGSAQDSGNLGWFTQGQMVPEFNDASFEGEVGDMPIVTTQFGVHLIEILDKTADKKQALIATVDRVIAPSKETYDVIYNEASAFSINNSSPEKFKQTGNEKGIVTVDAVKQNDKYLTGLETPRDLIRWAYNAEVGSISEPFEIGQKFVVAHLTGIKEKGQLGLDNPQVKERVKAEVIKEKKAEQLMAKMKGSDLNAIASSVNSTVQNAERLSLSSFTVPGIGTAKTLVGAASALPQGQLSKPLKGESGVFATIVSQIIEAPEATDFSPNKGTLNQRIASRADYQVMEEVKEKANIVDNRGKFF